MTEFVSIISSSDTAASQSVTSQSQRDDVKSVFDVTLAATYLDDALLNRHIDFRSEPKDVRLYNLYKSPILRFLLYLSFFTNVALALFEEPAVDGLGIPYWGSLIIELACMGFLAFRLIHERMFSDKSIFWKDTKHITYVSILTLTILDIVIYVFMRNTAGHGIRWSRPLRPFMIINFPESRQVRRAFRNTRNTLPDILNVLVLLIASIALFSLMAVKLFKDKELSKIGSESYFENFLDSFWDLFVLVTTSNSPDIMMPAYDYQRWFSLFFIIFLIVNLYMFMGVFLAVVYNSYKNNLKKETHESVEQKRKLLTLAFQSIKVDVEGKGVVTKPLFFRLMRETFPRKKVEFFELLWLVMDQNDKGHIDLKVFMDIYELSHLSVKSIADDQTLAEKCCPNVYNSKYSKLFIKCVKHIYFRYVFDLAIFANAIFIAFDLDGGEWFFLTIFSLEILSKIYAFGVSDFFQKLWNIFDSIVVGSALIVSLLALAIRQDGQSGYGDALDFLMVLRVVRIFKIFHSIPRFRIVINTILHILPSFATYGCLLLLVFYFFAIIGMEVFGGKIVYDTSSSFCGNSKLNNSYFARDHYCSNNFNNIVSSFVTLFELMAVNQWHVLAEGHVLVTTKAARVFFFSFHCICVIVVLNIFSAFVIEAFILEFTSAKMKPSSSLLNRIYLMGLGLGGRPPSKASSDTKKVNQASEKLVTIDDDDNDVLDADHNRRLNGDVIVVDQTNVVDDFSTTTFRNASHLTKLRFHLTKRSRTLQGLLEKMFENELKEIED